MKIAILSDIHDNIWYLSAALTNLQAAELLICCGDLCSPFVVSLLASGFADRPVHIVFGNNDGDLFRIARVASRYPHIHLQGELFEAEIDGKRIAANHYDQIAAGLAHSGKYDLVCYGHNHHYQIEKVGQTLAINPGAIMGYDPLNSQDIPATFVIVDLQTGTATGYQVVAPSKNGLRVAPISANRPGISKPAAA